MVTIEELLLARLREGAEDPLATFEKEVEDLMKARKGLVYNHRVPPKRKLNADGVMLLPKEK